MGYFNYVIDMRPGLSSGTEVRNVAVITFDSGEIIATNQVDPHDPLQGTDPDKEALVTIDAGLPTSSVDPLPSEVILTSFSVTWSGGDDPGGSGIATVDIYVSENGGPFELWRSLMEHSAIFDGVPFATYAFYSVARDNVGYVEAAPGTADTSTTLVPYGDFNQDGSFDLADIDLLVGEIAAGTHHGQFDANGDGLVDLADRDAWLSNAGAVNIGVGKSYLLGDANLDGRVDVSDFNAWNSNKFTYVTKWSRGDFNADGTADVSDFDIWNRHKFTSSDPAHVSGVLTAVSITTTYGPLETSNGRRFERPRARLVDQVWAASDGHVDATPRTLADFQWSLASVGKLNLRSAYRGGSEDHATRDKTSHTTDTIFTRFDDLLDSACGGPCLR
jgi:hypothetical protein